MVAPSTAGHGARAAVRYLMHDKPSEEDPRPTTSNRVAWTHTINLATDNIEESGRIIQGHRYDAPWLKAAAGVRPGGRPLKENLQLFTLSWHPSENPTQQEMISAVLEAATELGLEKLPLILVAHSDRDHAHVHVIASRIDPETGRAKNIHEPKKKLSRWAAEYEQRRGRIFVPRRLERQEARARYNPAAPTPLPPMQRRHRPGGRTPHTEEETSEWRSIVRNQQGQPDADPANHLAARVALSQLQARRRAVNGRLAEIRSGVRAGIRTGTRQLGGGLVASASTVSAGVATTATRAMTFAAQATTWGLGAGGRTGLALGSGGLALGATTVRGLGRGLRGIARLPSRAVDVAMALIPGDGGAEADRYDRAVRSVERDRRHGLNLRAPRPSTPTPSEPPSAKKKTSRSWTSWRKPAALPRPPQRSGTMPSPKPAPPLAGSRGPDHTGRGPRR